MSSRSLRKLRGDKDLEEIQAKLSLSSQKHEIEKDVTGNTSSLNVFDLLNDVSSSEGETVDSVENNTIIPEPKISPSNKAKKRKKKKKKKVEKLETLSNNDDDLDLILSELNVEPSFVKSPTGHDAASGQFKSASLTVIRKHLNADNELRRMFGREAIENRGTGSQFRKRSYIFASPKSTWPPMTKFGIQMIVDKNVDGMTYFKYVHSKTNYQRLQQIFWRASHHADPHAVRQVLELHPYHIDTLLHLSEVCRVSEDSQTASDLLNRALFCLERAFHPNFNVASLNCRMDYDRSENRSLFVALFRQILFVSQKSCWQTAFELAKLLYNINPEQDPMAILLIIDILALKVEDFRFIIQFIDEFDHSLKLTMLPNFAFSHSIAQFYKEVVEGLPHQISKGLLQKAVLNYPMIAQLICEKHSFVIESNTHYVMNEDVLKSHTRSLTQQCKLYLERSSDLWKDAKVTNWFKESVDFVNLHHATMPGYKEAQNRRKSVFLSPPLNVMRHIFISDISSVSALLPNSAFESTQDPHDPMPPPTSYSDYQPETTQVHSGNPVMAFINSLMPGFTGNPEDGQEVGGVDLGGFLHPIGEDNRAGQWGEQLRNIPGDFGVALRDMLANLYRQGNQDAMPDVVDEASDSNDDQAVMEDDLD